MNSTVWLVWSNEAGAWWSSAWGLYTRDVWEAGRYNEAEAVKACALRTWSPATPPPEVLVLAPEHDRRMFTVEQIRAVRKLMRQRIEEATRQAVQAHGSAAATAEASS